MRLVVIAMILSFLASPVAATDPAAVATSPPKVPVVGAATIPGDAKKATLTWTYTVDGKEVRSRRAPKMRIVRIASNVPKMAVKLPTDIFAIKIGPDMQRIFDEPVLLDSDQTVECSCRMRPQCGKGEEFRCEVEGYLVE